MANRAEGGSAIIMNPHTGEILAMANEPTFNPNVYREFDELARRNRAVQDLYEPGSTFKVVTASAAIEEQVMPIDTMIDTNPGVIRIAGRAKPVTEANTTTTSALSFTDVIVKSSNVGAIKIGLKVGTERLSRFVRAVRVRPSRVAGFPRREPGHRLERRQMDRERARVRVDGLPGRRHAAPDGGGCQFRRQRRRVRRAARGPRRLSDDRRYVIAPKVVRRTISADTAATLTASWRTSSSAARRRQGADAGLHHRRANRHGREAGQRPLLDSDYNASFVGFVPSRNPVVAIIVVTDSPHDGPTTGGPVSGPVFKRIAEATLRYLGVGPTINPDPPVLVASGEDAVDASGPSARAAQHPRHQRRSSRHDARPSRNERPRCHAQARQTRPDRSIRRRWLRGRAGSAVRRRPRWRRLNAG